MHVCVFVCVCVCVRVCVCVCVCVFMHGLNFWGSREYVYFHSVEITWGSVETSYMATHWYGVLEAPSITLPGM